jgi:predicted negative regulator of RcsB-dependent stress response
VDTTIAQVRRIGAPRAIALCQCFNGTLEFQSGHWVEAESALRESIQLFRQIGAAAGEAVACQRLGVLQTAQGQLDEGLATLEDGLVAAKHALMRNHLFGRLHAAIAHNRLLAGDLPAADHALSLGFTLTEDHGHCTVCESFLLPVAVSLRIAQGDLAAAEDYYCQLDEAATRYGSQTWLATAHRVRGELATAHGDIETAMACYEEALAGFQEAKNEYEAAQCLEALEQLRLKQPAAETIALKN